MTVDKKMVREKESVHLAFPFAVPGADRPGRHRLGLGAAGDRPARRRLPGLLLRPRRRRHLERRVRA
ncbi:MAG: hypothetical protein M0C28_48035 [Candidatus Moduliflexus flocculans]|nr:hypothetical protein [Candidatus Moduliflexus flocculans]